MKVYHLVCGRPIGPTFRVYLEKPNYEPDEDDSIGSWIEETTLEEVTQAFQKHVLYGIEHFPASYFPLELKIEKRMAIQESPVKKP